MSEQDDYTWSFKEQAMINTIADKTVEKMANRFPSLKSSNQNISWADFLYSLAKGSAAMILGFIALAALWATIQYVKAGAPAMPGVTH